MCSNLNTILKTLLESNTTSFNRKAEAMLIPESGWDSKVVSHKEDLKSHLNSLVENCKQKLLDRLASTSQKQQEQGMKDLIHNHIANISPTLARNLIDSYGKELEQHNVNMAPILKQGFGLSTQDTFDFLSKSENAIFESCVRELKAVFRSQTNP